MISLIDFGFKPCQKISALHGLYNQSARGIKQSTWNIFCSAFTFNSLGIHININKLVSFTDTPIRFYHVLRLDNVFKWGKYISFFFMTTKVYHSPRCTSLFLLPRFWGCIGEYLCAQHFVCLCFACLLATQTRTHTFIWQLELLAWSSGFYALE